jgi:hypothetical protein
MRWSVLGFLTSEMIAGIFGPPDSCASLYRGMLGGVALKQGNWVAYGVLLLGTAWLMLTASGELGGLAQRLAGHLPASLVLTAVLAIPVLAALCSLHLQVDWRVRIALFLVLLGCVPLLPLAFDSHPVVVIVVIVIFMVEEFGIIPQVNRRWIARS